MYHEIHKGRFPSKNTFSSSKQEIIKNEIYRRLHIHPICKNTKMLKRICNSTVFTIGQYITNNLFSEFFFIII